MNRQVRKGWARASLRISSDTVSFEWITEQLGLTADRGGNRGEPIARTSVRQTTLWVLRSGLPADSYLEDHVQQLLRRIQGRHAAIEAIGAECQLGIFAGAFADDGQIGETLS